MIDANIDYGIRLTTGVTESSSQKRVYRAQMELCTCLEEINNLMADELGGGSISIKYQTPTSIIGDVKLLISSDKPLSRASIDCVQDFLAKSRRMILTSLNRMKSKTDFDYLHKELIVLEKNFDDTEYAELIPTLSLSKKLLAETIIKLSKITMGRANELKITYNDHYGMIVFECEKPIEIDTLLGAFKKDETIYDAIFTIRRAPGTRDASFDLLLDRKKIKHEIKDENFWRDWENGVHIFKYHSTMPAKYQISRTHDSTTLEIVKVEKIRPPSGFGLQMSLDGID